MIINEHWLESALKVPSPNFDSRPDEDDISLIVIHCISLPPGEFGGDHINQLFLNRLDPKAHRYFKSIFKFRVSSHILLDRRGQTIQYVPFHMRAWHAGRSCFEGRSSCNDYSIGIELEGTETTPYLDTQYARLADLIGSLLKYYPNLSRKRIVGHSSIAPDRKTDPGDSFDWNRLEHMLN